MEYKIIRPSDLSEDKRKELERYLLEHWRRAYEARATQVDSDYVRWDKNYYAIPREAKRTLPWTNSSNFVVPIIRIFLDTFIARTLNVIFATRPLITVDDFPREHREALQLYLDRKALTEWQYYRLAKDILFRGNKNGTAVIKTTWHQQETYDIFVDNGQEVEQRLIVYRGPKHYVIPFEDVCMYPCTANYPEDVVIWFHRVRYVEEVARRLHRDGYWQLSAEELESSLKEPQDIKREQAQNEAGVQDYRYRELQAVECHLEYAIGPSEDKYYSIVGVIIPESGKLVDVYFNPLPRNRSNFDIYRPFPKEDLIYGESMCQILEQLQEETSTIHNDRRNNSYISNAPIFKRRSGSQLPNPSTNWYPGKVWDLEDMTDFEAVSIGRNYDDMLAQEQYGLQLGERLSGIGAAMQGYAAGMMGKRGIYNAAGTLALLSESNQRQDTNIRDVREVLGDLAKAACGLQAAFGADDPLIETWPRDMQDQLRAALAAANPKTLSSSRFQIKTSSAGVNRETERQSILEMVKVLGEYGATVTQIATQLVNPQLNQGLRLIMNDVVKMHRWMATRVLRAWDEHDLEEIVPDAQAAINAVIPGGGAGTSDSAGEPGAAGLDLGGGVGVRAMPSRQELTTIASLPGLPQ